MKQLLSFLVCIGCSGVLHAQAPARTPGNAPVAPAAAPNVAPNGVEEPAPAAPVVDAYRGTLAHGLDELRALAEKGDTQQALAIADQLLAPGRFARWRERALASEGWHKKLVETADPLLDWLGVNSVPPEHRAAVHYARGVVLSQSGDRGASEQAFERARELAGVGALRLDSIYNLGVSALFEGEEFRAQIPELKAAAGAPQASAPVPPTLPTLPGAAGANGANPAAPPPDPLQLARAAYLKAREHFVERLRSAWQDDDTQANVELVQRRLKELAQLEKKREEEKKKQEQEQKDQQQKDQQQKDQKQQKQDQGKPDEQQKDKDKSQDQKDQQQDQQKPDADKQPEEQKPDEQKDKTQEQKDKEAQQKEQQKKEAAQGEPKEELLTKEEMTRLLDILKQREEQGQRLLEQLHRTRRAKVKKDW